MKTKHNNKKKVRKKKALGKTVLKKKTVNINYYICSADCHNKKKEAPTSLWLKLKSYLGFGATLIELFKKIID